MTDLAAEMYFSEEAKQKKVLSQVIDAVCCIQDADFYNLEELYNANAKERFVESVEVSYVFFFTI